MKSTRAHMVYGPFFAVVLVSMIGFIPSGCGKNADKKEDIPAASFRADPSKMTPAEKSRFETLTRSSTSPPPKSP